VKNHPAPWSTVLIVVSTLATMICVGGSVILFSNTHGAPQWLAPLPLGLALGSALFTIRGYAITPDAILIRRLFWTTRLPRAELQSARSEPDAMRGSLRTFGNGGLFSFSGFFWSKALGSYRAWVTDPHRTVVLVYAQRKVVISPEVPEDFVRDLEVGTVMAPTSRD
jgi:hypothetical protein